MSNLSHICLPVTLGTEISVRDKIVYNTEVHVLGNANTNDKLFRCPLCYLNVITDCTFTIFTVSGPLYWELQKCAQYDHRGTSSLLEWSTHHWGLQTTNELFASYHPKPQIPQPNISSSISIYDHFNTHASSTEQKNLGNKYTTRVSFFDPIRNFGLEKIIVALREMLY